MENMLPPKGSRILLITDAWEPQINGVVRTLTRMRDEAVEMGYDFHVIAPDQFKTFPMPTYPEIKLSLTTSKSISNKINAISPDYIHIATEGPLGILARRYCVKSNYPFTTSYHTKFPEYIKARFPIPLKWGYRFVRWFHAPSHGVMVVTKTVREELTHWGFKNLKNWSRGVDAKQFSPDHSKAISLESPVYCYVGRVAVEKNIEAFLNLDLQGSKLVVGGGPALEQLKKKYKDVTFVGPKRGQELAAHYCSADVFVFPSKTDTFGVVIIEALASGLPVAAFPVPGPLDIIGDNDVGMLNEDLKSACIEALAIDKNKCVDFAKEFTWKKAAHQFLGHLSPISKSDHK